MTAVCCKKPTPVEASEDTYQELIGMLVWIEGETWTACARCGTSLTPRLRRQSAPEEKR